MLLAGDRYENAGDRGPCDDLPGDTATVLAKDPQGWPTVFRACAGKWRWVSSGRDLSPHDMVVLWPYGQSGTLHVPWHFLYFLPLPQGQGSLRPTLFSVRWAGACAVIGSSPRFKVSLGGGCEIICCGGGAGCSPS